MLIFVFSTITITLIYMITATISHFIKSDLCKKAKHMMMNFVKRFVLFMFLELMICSFITLSDPAKVASIWWLVSLASIAGSVVTISFLLYRTIKVTTMKIEEIGRA